MSNFIKNEPVAFGAAVQAIIAAVFAFCAAFDLWHPTDTQIASVMGVWVAVIALIGAWQRSKVSPTGSKK